MRRGWILLIAGATVAGAFLRFWNLSSVPPALYCDEALQGYEAYCLLKTGADSRGVIMPFFFDVFGAGWEEPLYIYLTTLPVAILGTTEAATRAVAAAGGTLLILAVAWLAYEIAGRRAAVAAGAFTAFSPWAFHVSRAGFQASLLPLFLAAGAAALLRGIRSDAEAGRGAEEESVAFPGSRLDDGKRGGPDARPDDQNGPGRPPVRPEEMPPASSSSVRFRWLAGGAALLTAALYTYVAARALVPLLLLLFAASHFRRLSAVPMRRRAILAGIVALVALPVLLFSLTPEGQARYVDVGLTSYFSGMEAAGRFLSSYVSYFSPAFLLTEGDPILRHSVRGFGMLHPHDLVFLLAGVLVALRRRWPADMFLLGWLAAGPVPAAFAIDPMHSIRAIGTVPAIYALAGTGLAAIFSPGAVAELARPRGKTVMGVILVAALATSGAYMHHYFVLYPRYSAPDWQYGLKEAFGMVKERARAHDSIYVTTEETSPYIHRLYLHAFPPEEFQKHGFRRSKYFFQPPPMESDGRVEGLENPIYLLKPHQVPGTLMRRQMVLYPDGTPAYVVAW